MFSAADVEEVRYVVQRILVPCVFVIGLLGNSVSIYVLTRKRMRCTTNIYLTALAITDIIYLTMALLLSLQHYDYIRRNCELYWRAYGLLIWLCDACAYISIYIAVCFTIERFIAIRYPLKRQTFCTERLAKRVIVAVSVFCLLSTISTAFEHQYRVDNEWIDVNGKPCQALENAMSQRPSSVDYIGSGDGLKDADKHDHAARTLTLGTFSPYDLDEMGFLGINTNVSGFANPHVQPKEGGDGAFYPREDCRNITYFRNTGSSLANNEVYMRFWYFFTLCMFVLIPLGVLGTFNCFLIVLVRRSKSLRCEMTNASSIRRRNNTKGKTHSSSVSQENRITVTLIAVVLLFIVCQLPWAIYLIVLEHTDIDRNTQMVIGNIFNFLAAINAAANFFLYCVLSDKYRKTVRELTIGFRYRAQRKFTENHNSFYTTANTSTVGSRRHRPK